MNNFDDATKGNIKEHNPNWSQISDHSYKILIIGGSAYGKTSSLFNLISQQPDIDKVYMLKIDMKQNINFQLTYKKAQD